jgi:RimJ/RimL family protein N-acetyltransferase
VELQAEGLLIQMAPVQEVLALDHGLSRAGYDTRDYPRLIGFLLIRTHDRTVVGSVLLERERRDWATVWIDYAIAEPQRRQGYCNKAVARIAAWARKDVGASSVLAEILDNNVASERCAATAGFVPSAERRGVWEYRANKG